MTKDRKPITRVYHAVPATYPSPGEPCASWPEGYQPVAEIETADLDEAFRMTNHLEKDWTLNRGVNALVEVCRSTSVGDVIVTPDGEAYLVLTRGFQPLGRVW